MSLPLILLGAKAGTDLLGLMSQRATSQANIRIQRAQNRLNQYQLERQGRMQADERRRQFADALGAQRAQIASSGIAGGRTARLIEAESQSTFTRQEQEAEQQLRFGRGQLDTRRRGLSFASKMADRQFGLDLFGAALSAGLQGHRIQQARKAEGL